MYLKYFWSQNVSRLKISFTQRYFVRKVFWTKSYFSKKKCLYQKSLGYKIFSGPTFLFNQKNLDQIFLLTKIVLIIYIFGNLWQLKATPSCFMINSDIGGGPFFVTILYATCGGKKGKGSVRVKIFLFSFIRLKVKH